MCEKKNSTCNYEFDIIKKKNPSLKPWNTGVNIKWNSEHSGNPVYILMLCVNEY